MTTITAPEPVYKVPEVAHHFGCDRETVYRMIHAGTLRAIRVGRTLRIPQSALNDFINGGTK
jgi:excisionase family DNA binding protein